MLTYRYQALDQRGDLVSGLVNAPDKDSAEQKLGQSDLLAIKVRQQRLGLPGFKPRLSLSQIAFLLEQLALLVRGGVSLPGAIALAASQRQGRTAAYWLNHLASRIDAGESFSSALQANPVPVGSACILIIKSGELNGRLGPALEQVAEFLRTEHERLSRLRASLSYPLLLALVLSLIAIIMIGAVLPRVASLALSLNVEPNYITLLLLELRQQLQRLPVSVVLLLSLLPVVVILVMARSRSLRSWCYWHIPLGRHYWQQHFARVLWILAGAGIAPVQSLETLLTTGPHPGLKKRILSAIDRVRHGDLLSRALQGQGLIADRVLDILHSGEESADLDTSLSLITRYQENCYERSAQLMLSLLPPAIILLFGGVLALAVVATFWPLYQLISSVSA